MIGLNKHGVHFPSLSTRNVSKRLTEKYTFHIYSKTLMRQVNLITRQLSVVVISRQSEAGVAFLSGANALQHIKPCKSKQSAVYNQAEFHHDYLQHAGCGFFFQSTVHFGGGWPLASSSKFLLQSSICNTGVLLHWQKKCSTVCNKKLAKLRIYLSCICYLYIILFSTSNITIISKSQQLRLRSSTSKWQAWMLFTEMKGF